MENGISVNEAGQKMGLKPGDKILKIDGKPALSFNNSAINMLFADQVTVMREGKEVTFDINKEGVGEVLKSGGRGYIAPRVPVIVDSAIAGGAKEAGLMKGDKIVGVNGKSIICFNF